jgi:Leucine-rich repeat (LRR) protein
LGQPDPTGSDRPEPLSFQPSTICGASSLKGLKTLSLAGTKVTNRGIQELKELVRLQGLDLTDTPVTDSGARALQVHLPQLSMMRKSSVLAAAEHAMAAYEKYKATYDFDDKGSLIELNLSDAAVEDKDLVYLTGITSLRRLVLAGTRITDNGLINLDGLSGLQFLDLSRTAITSEGLLRLENLINLRTLVLSHTKIGDEGLQHLKRLPKLTSLKLTGTKVTKAGLKRLREELPKLITEHD